MDAKARRVVLGRVQKLGLQQLKRIAYYALVEADDAPGSLFGRIVLSLERGRLVMPPEECHR